MIGAAGYGLSLGLFCVSFFGFYATLFLVSMLLSFVLILAAAAAHVKQVGLLSFLSPELQ